MKLIIVFFFLDASIKSPRDIRLRNKKHLDKLKETGRYEDYKKKKAECAKKRRLQAKNNEQYLPPEIQLHIMNERRRATRERVKRCRERKSQMMTETVQSAVTYVFYWTNASGYLHILK